RADDRTDAEIVLAWLKDNDPENPVSLNLLYQEEMEKENYKAAGELLDKLEKKYGEDANTAEKRIELTAKNGNQNDVIKLVEEGYKKYPEVYFFVNLKQVVEQSVNKDYGAAISVLRKYLKNNYSVDAYYTMASYYFKKGQVQEGLKIYELLIEKRP